MRFQFFIEASFIVDTIKGWYVSWKRHYFFFFLVVLFQKCGLLFCGAVHTWCLGTTAWISAQNGVVFTLWVPDICDCVHSYALSDSILKHELSSENKAVDCPELTKIVCTEGSGTHFCAQILSWVPEKKGVLTLVPSEYRTWADRARATSAVKDAKLIDLLTYYVILGPHTLLSLIIIKILCVFFSLLFSVIQNWKRLFHHVLNIFTWVSWFLF